MKKTMIAAAILFLPVLSYVGFNSWLLEPQYNVPATEVKQGPFRIVLHQLGEVQAVKSTYITADDAGEVADLIPEGTSVKEGEPVARLETTDLENELEKARTALQIAETRLEKALENSSLEKKLNELAVKEAKANLAYRKTQLENAETNLEKTRRLVEENLSPRKNLQEAELRLRSEELQYQNAVIALEKARDKLKSQLQLQKSDVETALIEVEKAQAEFDNASDRLQKAAVKAPTSGIVMYEKVWKAGTLEKVSVGTRIGPWTPFLQIPDLSDMEIVTLVDEIDISRLELGMPASITLDAFPDLKLTGETAKISTLAKDMGQDVGWGREKKQKGRKVFEVAVHINEKIPELRPGITAVVEILIDEFEDVLYVPIESLFGSEDEEYVFVMDDGRPKKVKVKAGPANYHDVIIEEGLTEGRSVCLANPYENGNNL